MFVIVKAASTTSVGRLFVFLAGIQVEVAHAHLRVSHGRRSRRAVPGRACGFRNPCAS